MNKVSILGGIDDQRSILGGIEGGIDEKSKYIR